MTEADVVIVGAGLAGLTAAEHLVSKGRSVLVLEARDRVGGRTLSHRTAHGEVVDLGAQWIGPTQDRLQALVRRFGLTEVAQHHEGKKVLDLDGKLRSYRADIPTLPILGLLDLGRTIPRVERLARQVPLADPMSAPKAHAHDAMTVETWKQAHVATRSARAMVDAAVHAIFACEPAELSFLFFLQYLHSGGGMMKLANIAGGAQETRVAEGFQTISIRIAEALGERVRLEHPVRAIEATPGRAIVHHDRGTVHARRVIVAIPPTLAGRIDYRPSLPAARDRLTQRMAMGSVVKCIAFYDRPFWREEGWSGEVVCDRGPIRIAFDDSPANASSGALLGFITGSAALQASELTVEQRRAMVIDSFARFFGPRARAPIDYVDQPWPAERWSRGCYVGLLPPGALTQLGDALRAPCGPVHWAGTETALRWMGYMEGAIESGERAAAEVARSIEAE